MRHLLTLLFLSVSAQAYTGSSPTFTSNGTVSDTQAAIDAAADGDTVIIGGGGGTWTSGITIAGKGIKLQGEGAGRVVARSASSVAVGTGTKTFTLTTESVSSIEDLKAAITNGTTLRIWRVGGGLSGGAPTYTLPWMQGTVTSLVGSTLTMDITSTNSTGTHPAWIIATAATTTLVMNVASTDLVSVTEDVSHSVEISGIRFEHDAGLSADVNTQANFIKILATSGASPVLIHDCSFYNFTYGNQIFTRSNKGVVWDCSFVSPQYSSAALALHGAAPSISDSWTTASTMGTADTTGKSNFYVEDCDFHAWQNATDWDDNMRSVVRYSLFNNSGWGSHGADSSSYGIRHFEIYGCEFVRNDYSDGQTLNVGWWVLLRGGTGVIYNNITPVTGGSDYGQNAGTKLAVWNLQFSGGPNPLWGKDIEGAQYHCPRQIGFGYTTGTTTDGAGRTSDSITKVGDSEPLYIWGNTGAMTVAGSNYATPGAGEDTVGDYVQSGRDYFYDGTAKPGWAAYEYPHPLRSGEAAPSAAPRYTPPKSKGQINRRR